MSAKSKLKLFFKQQAERLAKIIADHPELAPQYGGVAQQLASATENLEPDAEAAVDLEAILAFSETALETSRQLASGFSNQVVTLKKTNTEKDGVIADLTGKLAAQETLVTSGELIPKTRATELASAAHDTGVAEGRAAAEQAHAAAEALKARIAGRRQQLASASIAEPMDEAPLTVEDEAAFTAAQTEAGVRTKALLGKGLQLASATVRRAAWLSAEAYAAEVAAIDEILASRKGGAPAPEPNRYQTPPDTTGARVLGCV